MFGFPPISHNTMPSVCAWVPTHPYTILGFCPCLQLSLCIALLFIYSYHKFVHKLFKMNLFKSYFRITSKVHVEHV